MFESLNIAIEMCKPSLMARCALELLETDPLDPRALAALAQAHTLQEEYELADSYSIKLLQSANPDWTGLGYLMLAETQYTQGNVDEATRFVEEALVYLPNNSTVLARAALYRMVKGEHEKALVLVRSTLREDPDEGFCRAAEIYLSFRIEGLQLTEQDLDDLMAIDPSSWFTHYFRGRIENLMGNHQKGIDFMTSCLVLEPELDWAKSALLSWSSSSSIAFE